MTTTTIGTSSNATLRTNGSAVPPGPASKSSMRKKRITGRDDLSDAAKQAIFCDNVEAFYGRGK